MKLKELVKLTKEEEGMFKGSFDIIGKVAILELDDKLKTKKKKIAKAVMKIYPFVKTVLNKKTERGGKLRLRKFETLIGKNTETVHKESGCLFKLDVKKTYFSPREGTERLRIAEQVKPGENVLVMFGGIAPYAIVIAKTQPSVREVYSIELNKQAHKYALESIKLNKMNNIVFSLQGDVKEMARKYYGKCDRVIMPLPKEGYKYLADALKCLKPKGIIHFYFVSETPEEAVKILKKEAGKQKKKIKVLNKRKVLPYSPGVFKWCIEGMVS
ncbi:MAG: class I SAM-dependent methyltransferase family protein [Candidatus Aenigmarchaeota archaeon]|nr:class I SAM-dependent methyltransferase family protein [Candidatus Aenigmarchaeota archaeon]